MVSISALDTLHYLADNGPMSTTQNTEAPAHLTVTVPTAAAIKGGRAVEALRAAGFAADLVIDVDDDVAVILALLGKATIGIDADRDLDDDEKAAILAIVKPIADACPAS